MKDLVAKIRIEAEATGDEKIVAMVRQLEQLAEQGLEAAPAFAELANKLRELQAESGTGLAETAGQVDALGGAARSAEPAVDGLAGALEGVAQPDGLDEAAGQVGALGGAASSAAPAVDGLSNAIAGVAQPAGLDRTAGQVGALGSAATGAAPAVDELSSALAGVAQPDDLANTAGQMGALGGAATGAAPAVEDLSGAMQGVAQPDGLDDTAGQMGALGSAATGAAPAVDGLSSAIAGVAQPAGLDKTAGQVGALGSAATGAAPAVDGLSNALEGVAQPVGLGDTAGQVGTLGSAAASAAPAVDGLSNAIAGVSQPVGLGDTAGQLGAVGRAAATADPAVGSLERQMGELGSATAESADALGEMGAAASDARSGVDELAEGATEAADAVNQLSGAQPQLEGLAQAIAAIFALAQLKQAAGSAIELADAFGQMDARVRMATTGAEEYERVQARLLDTANKTFRPLAEQQELYIRTADALRSVGLSTEQAVDVTDAFSYLLTTNAASADRAKSAIDAYSKSLASGKVDVDAWMSITTAMPTVVDAIAASMGKSSAEIRQLGVNGAISLEAVNKALLQTRDASEQTAATMDATLNDAVQRLQNNWGRYLADLNQTYGVTEKLVGGLVTLSENLDAVGKAAGTAGMVALVAAITAAEIKMYGYIVALKAYIGTAAGAAAATTALTVALGNLAAGTWVWAIYKNAEALEEYRARAVAAELATLNLALNQGRLQDRFEDISRSTGVAVSSMAELNQAVEEGRLHFDALTTSWRAGASSMSAVAEATQHLSAGAKALAEDYYKLREAGKNTADALKGAFKGITNPEDFRGIQAMGQALAELGTTGEISARQVDEAWRTALANLSGADLAKFATTASQVFGDSATEAAALTSALRVTAEQLGKMSGTELQQFGLIAKKAFEDGRLEAEAFARINDQVLTASFEKLGISAAVALGKISPAAQEAIDGVDGIVVALASAKVSAEQSALAIEMALTKAFASADTKEALGELVDRMEALDAAGKIGVEAFARLAHAAAEAQKRIEDLTPGIQSVQEAFRNLGVKSQDELRYLASVAKQSFDFIRESGQAAPKDIEASFKSYAAAAIEANDGVADATIKSQARMLGLRVEADETGKTVVRTMEESAEAAKKLADATEKTSAGMSALGKAAAGAAAAGTTLAETWDEAGNLISEGMDKSVSAGRDAGELVGLYSEQQIRAIRTIDKALQEHTQNILRNHNERIIAAGAEERALDRLAAKQAQYNSSAAQGLDDLKLRYLELNGTEEQVAKARQARDQAELQRKIALLQIDAQRAALTDDDGLVKQLKDEIALMKEQLVWLDKIFKEEEKQRKAREREDEKAEKRRAREQRDRDRNQADDSDTTRSRGSSNSSNAGGNSNSSNAGGNSNSSNAGGNSNSSNAGGNSNSKPNNTGNRPAVANGPVVNITLQPGANLNDRAEVERFARLIAPAIQDLTRRGF